MLKKFAYMILALSAAAFAGNEAFELTVANVSNGTIQYGGSEFASGSAAYAGATVNVSYFPATGYVLENAKVYKTADATEEITLQKVSGNNYSFTMPSAAVTITGTFKKGSYTVTVNGCTLLTCPEASVHEFGSQVSVTITKPSNVVGSFSPAISGLDSSALTRSNNGVDYVYTFAMPGHNVTFTVKENLSVKPTRYKIAFEGCENLNCSAPDSADVGETVTIRVLSTESHWASGAAISGFDKDDVISSKSDEDSTVYVITMPYNDITMTLVAQKKKYQVSVDTDVSNGAISISGSSNHLEAYKNFGSNVSFTVTPDRNYEIDFVKVVKADDASVTVKTTEQNGVYTYKVPGYNTIITAAFKEIPGSSSSEDGPEDPQDGSSSSSEKVEPSSSAPDSQNSSSSEDNGYYCVDIVPDENGTIQMAGSFSKQNKDCTLEGTEITLGVYPESGYILESISVKKKNGDKVSLEDLGSSTYKFKMPGSDVTVKATYKVGEYEVNVEGCGELKCEVSKTKAKAGDDIKVTITLVSGYVGFTLSAKGLASVDREDSGAKTTISFTMPGNDVTIIVEPQAKSGTATSSSSGKGDVEDKSSSSKGEVEDKSSSSGSKSGKSSSSNKSKDDKSSSSKGKGGKDAIQVSAQLPQFSVVAADRRILVSGVPAGADYFLLDINGRVMSQGCSVAQDFAIVVPRAGYYLLRVGNTVRTVNVQ